MHIQSIPSDTTSILNSDFFGIDIVCWFQALQALCVCGGQRRTELLGYGVSWDTEEVNPMVTGKPMSPNLAI